MFESKHKSLQNITVADLRSFLDECNENDKVCISTVKNGWTDIHRTHGLQIHNGKEQTGWFSLFKS